MDEATYRAVLADDVPEIREILAVMLEQSGRFRVVGHASTGWEAVAVARREQPDVVVLDIDMPGGSGWEALAEIRQAVPSAQVVILSGAPEDVQAADEVTRSMAAGVLEKGVTGTELVDRLLQAVASEPQPPPVVRPRPPALDAVVDIGLDVDDVGGAVTARDVTMRRHSAAALARAVAQLERQNRELTRSNEELDSFAYVASHDLAQPLQVAYGYLEMLREDFGESLDPLAREWLGAALTSLERMRRLVRDILRYSRSGSGAALRGPVDLEEVVADIVEGLDLTLAEAGARVQMGDLPTVLGDAGQLGQVVQNLVANAVKFRRPGVAPLVTITAAATRSGEVEVRVADNGVGVAEEHRERVFEMFQRGTPRDVDGTGLGLAICRKIIARHGGTISLEPRADGPGTVVRFTLPTA